MAEYEVAEKMLKDSIAIYSEIGDQRAKGAHLGSLGELYLHTSTLWPRSIGRSSEYL